MEQLLEMAQHVCDQAEVYSTEHASHAVTFENAELHDIDSTFQAGLSLRIIKDGKLGFAYIRNLLNREDLLQNALNSLEGGVEAEYSFPLTRDLPQLDTYSPSLEELSTTDMVEENARVCELLRMQTDGEIRMNSYARHGNIRILNSAGTDISTHYSNYGASCEIIYPGSGSGVERELSAKTFQKIPDALVNEMMDLYTISSKIVQPKPGKMKIIFMPNSAYTLTWRILSGTNARNVYEHISPVAERIDEKIFHENLTIYDDPLDDSYPKARAFDDEGVACRCFLVVEEGVLKNFFYDLNYARKMKVKPTGHGYKTSIWGDDDTITVKPAPLLPYLTIKPGSASFSDMVRLIDRGLIIEGALGAHSGNIPNGDYSIGVNPGFYVENGEIIGRVKDTMAAGNIYDTLQHVLAVEDTLHPCWIGRMPAVLCDHVSVAVKA